MQKKIQILYFAALREQLNCAVEDLLLPEHVNNLLQLRDWLAERGEPWTSALHPQNNLRCAQNQMLCDWQSELQPAAEVAFFPPVTGG